MPWPHQPAPPSSRSAPEQRAHPNRFGHNLTLLFTLSLTSTSSLGRNLGYILLANPLLFVGINSIFEELFHIIRKNQCEGPG